LRQDLLELIRSKLKKDELASVLDAEDDHATKEELVRRLGRRRRTVSSTPSPPPCGEPPGGLSPAPAAAP